MAAILANTHPEVIAAAGVHSGLAPRSAQDVVSAFAAMRGDAAPGAEPVRAPAIIFHGSADATVAPVNAGRLSGPLDETARRSGVAPGRRFDVLAGRNASGHPVEVWRIDGAGHAWAGGHADGSYTDPAGPDASAEMVRFFLSSR
jgi:poly(3-hydroxybutyrate) depolymerase